MIEWYQRDSLKLSSSLNSEWGPLPNHYSQETSEITYETLNQHRPKDQLGTFLFLCVKILKGVSWAGAKLQRASARNALNYNENPLYSCPHVVQGRWMDFKIIHLSISISGWLLCPAVKFIRDDDCAMTPMYHAEETHPIHFHLLPKTINPCSHFD